MNISLIGYGKMGREIEQLCIKKGHHVYSIVDPTLGTDLTALEGTDLAIEFTQPSAAIANITFCLDHGIPIVSGTTGWHDKQMCIRDRTEGADIIMVKPAGLYTDVIYRLKDEIRKPIAAYHVSGEYAAIEIMAERGILDRANAHMESWAALRRSGATIIITYAAEKAIEWISDYEY